MLRYPVSQSAFLSAAETAHPSGERLPGRRSTPRPLAALWQWIPVAVLAFALYGAILRVAEFPTDGRGMVSAESAASVDPVDDDFPQDPLFAEPRTLFPLSGNDRTTFLSGTLQPPSITIAPLPPPPKS